MFDIGFSELVLIGILALLVLGPKRLPEVARTAGRGMARLRRFVSNVKQDFDRELHSEELAELRKLKHELDQTRQAFADSGNRMVQSLARSGNPDNNSSFPHPDDPVTEPVILPPQPKQSPARAKRKPASKASRTHGRRATKARKRR